MPAYPFTLYDEFNSQILLQQKPHRNSCGVFGIIAAPKVFTFLFPACQGGNATTCEGGGAIRW
jgi:hypothetical protein